MKPSEALAKHRDTIRRIVLESGMTNPRLFGSALHGDDAEGSDLDILVDPAPRTDLFEFAGLQMELESMIGIKVDLLTPNALPFKFRAKVLSEAQPI